MGIDSPVWHNQPANEITTEPTNLPTDQLTDLLKRVRSIPANDELELRVAVHDLHHLATDPNETYEQIDSAILRLCSDLIHRTSNYLPLTSVSKSLEAYQNRSYFRSINALIRTLLQQLEHPQEGLCLDALQLQQCKLDHIELTYASLRMSNLSQSQITRANLSYSNFAFANLMSASLAHSNLSHCLMESCDLSWCDLSDSDLHRNQLMNADLSGSILAHADLSSAILSGCNLNNSTVTDANLSFANLFGSRLHDIKFCGTDLTGTGVTPERLECAGMQFHSDRGTVWGESNDCAGRNPLDPAYYVEQQMLL